LNASDAIRGESLSKIYCSGDGEITVFDGLSLSVRSGERLAVIGESGAGKSTLLHLLGGLDRPTKGRVFAHGREVTGLNEFELARFRNQEVGFVWQNPSLLPEFTALENVTMPLLIRGVSPADAARTACEKLDEVGLTARRTHRAGELSGGEQQRIALARALAAGPRILLADEPTGNLDFRTGEKIIDLLAELHARHSLTSVFVTHNLAFAAGCDRILELERGSLHSPSAMELQAIGVVQDATRPGGGTYV
jgi:lipoprotein-releasing system ATP-binding protein